ncbi:hypothetical protein BD408DRAFT_127883 [Parasitella parasitica]|nr:hypothetical protein BD408DRAFT_127883 [Parasitella parasitica]
MVVFQPPEMERLVPSPVHTCANNVCGYKQYWLASWLLDATGSRTINQLSGAPKRLTWRSRLPLSRENSTILIRADNTTSLSYINKHGGIRSVHPPQDHDTSAAYQWDLQQNRRYGVSSHLFQAPMAHQAVHIQEDSDEYGASLQSIYLLTEQPSY